MDRAGVGEGRFASKLKLKIKFMADRYIIAADLAHLRIYRYSQEPGQFTPSLQPVDAFDFPDGRRSPYSRDTDMAGRFPNSHGRSPGMSSDERLPYEEEVHRRSVELIVERITSFMQSNPNSTWDLAAGSNLRNALLETLPDGVRRRLNQVISKDLVNVSPADLRTHFALR